MRKMRDYDKELVALSQKLNQLKAEKVQRLGELVMATGADRLDIETLTGGLLHIAEEPRRGGEREAWRIDGIAFFQNGGRRTLEAHRDEQQGAEVGTAGGAQR